MDTLNMPFQISLWRSLMITQITRIFDFLMNRLNMLLQTALCCSLMVTDIACIFDFIMDRLNMNLQITLLCSLIFTKITRISQSPMWSVKVLCQAVLCLEHFIANIAMYFWHWAHLHFFTRLHNLIRHTEKVGRKLLQFLYELPKGTTKYLMSEIGERVSLSSAYIFIS